MAKIIAVKKGAKNTIEVIVSFVIVAGGLWVTKKTGIQIPDELTTTLTVTGTAFLTGLVHGVQNWWKHKKPKVLPSNPVDNTSPDSPQV
jgi:hypothetical protein